MPTKDILINEQGGLFRCGFRNGPSLRPTGEIIYCRNDIFIFSRCYGEWSNKIYRDTRPKRRHRPVLIDYLFIDISSESLANMTGPYVLFYFLVHVRPIVLFPKPGIHLSPTTMTSQRTIMKLY